MKNFEITEKKRPNLAMTQVENGKAGKSFYTQKKGKKILPFLTVICLYSNVAFHSEGPCDYTFSL